MPILQPLLHINILMRKLTCILPVFGHRWWHMLWNTIHLKLVY